jgi:hypothetical protein
VQLADEIFHADKGFAEQKMVLLVEGPPTPGMRLLLNRHRHARKIKYLQREGERGSPFVSYVRMQAQGGGSGRRRGQKAGRGSKRSEAGQRRFREKGLKQGGGAVMGCGREYRHGCNSLGGFMVGAII